MKHPDEGMVHAWLDGALDDADAHELEAHVAECAECAPRVAEARGLIAASSRIVSQLDGVPARVVPMVVPMMLPIVAPRAGAPQRVARAWWRSPGLAAAALFCVTTATWVAVRRPASVRDVVAPAEATREVAPSATDTVNATAAAASAPPNSQPRAAAPSRDAAVSEPQKRRADTQPVAVKPAVGKAETTSEPKFARQLDAARAQFDRAAAAGAVASAPPPAVSSASDSASASARASAISAASGGSGARNSAIDSSTQKLAAPFRSSNMQRQSLAVASSDARAEATPASPFVSAPLAVVGCYQLTPIASLNDAVVTTKSAPARAMAGSVTTGATVAGAAAPAPMASLTLRSLRLTESLSVVPAAADQNRAAERVVSRDGRAVYVGHVTSANTSAPVKWMSVSPGVVNVTLPDGRTIRVRIAPDSTAKSIDAGRVEFNARRTSCP